MAIRFCFACTVDCNEQNVKKKWFLLFHDETMRACANLEKHGTLFQFVFFAYIRAVIMVFFLLFSWMCHYKQFMQFDWVSHSPCRVGMRSHCLLCSACTRVYGRCERVPRSHITCRTNIDVHSRAQARPWGACVSYVQCTVHRTSSWLVFGIHRCYCSFHLIYKYLYKK